MEQGITLIAIFHIIVALLLVTIVLLQDSKGGGVGGAFGGGSSQTLFGATGAANFLVKLTRGLAVCFMLSCFALTLLISKGGSHSIVDSMPVTPGTNAPAKAPATTPATNPPTSGKK